MWILAEYWPFFQARFMRNKRERSQEHQGNLTLDDQGDDNVQVWAPSQLEYTNLEIKSPGLTIRCEYWWNADYSSKLDSWETKGMVLRHQGRNLALDDQGDGNVQVWAPSQLEYTNLEMEVLSLTINWEYWLNDEYSSMPFTSSKIGMVPRTPRKSPIGWPTRPQSTSLSFHSAHIYLSRDGSTQSYHQLRILVKWQLFFHTIYIIKNTNNPENS